MATIEEVLKKARAADTAGDTEAARRFVQLAKKMAGAASSAPEGVTVSNDPSLRLAPPTAPGAEYQLLGIPAPSTAQQPSSPAQRGPLDTTKSMTAEPWAATKEYAYGILHPRESDIGKGIATNSTYVPGWSDVGASMANLGGAALSGLHTAMAGGAGLVGDATGLLGASPNSQQQLANDLMGMAEAAAGVAPLSAVEAGSARAALKADARMTGPAGAAKDLGVTPSLGMSGKIGGMTAAALEKVPFASDIVARDATRAVGEIEGAFRKIVPGGPSPALAGQLLQSGLKDFVGKFKNQSSQLYDNVARELPPGTRVDVSNLRRSVDEAKQYFAGNPELANKLGLTKWDGVLAEAEANGISWQGVRQLRTQIGEAIGSNRGALADEGIGRLKSLYGALTMDMDAAARAAGPKAYQAWTRANSYYAAGTKRVERSLDATISAKNPERAFEAFDALTQADRSTADITRMRQIKSSLSRDDWNEISSAIADRLGKARPGAQSADGTAFSPATFLTEWNKMSPEAKRILFDEPVRTELEKIAKVSERVRASGAERNLSNTGTIVSGAALVGAFSSAPTTATLALGGSVISAKAMTSPVFLRAVNSAMSGDARAIEAMAKGKGPYAQDAATLMRMTAAEVQDGGAANSTDPPRAVIGR